MISARNPMIDRILVTNDDGINAPGLQILIQIASELSDDVWVVAPETEQSGVSHALSLHSPLRFTEQNMQVYSVNGTPTDCVLMAVKEIMREKLPTLVLSGVNRGENVGEDVTYSGTVAAAMEGTLLGIPSIALSQAYHDLDHVHWENARSVAPKVIELLYDAGWPEGQFINVNFPACKPESVSGIKFVRQGKRKIGDMLIKREDPKGRSYFWIGPQRKDGRIVAGTDLAAIDQNYITITPLAVDLTADHTLHALNAQFDHSAFQFQTASLGQVQE
jgi:5'-nucleotidase